MNEDDNIFFSKPFIFIFIFFLIVCFDMYLN